MKKLLILTLIFALFSCGKSKDEKVNDSIDRANTLLTSRKCSEAISILEGLGRQTNNARYIVALASAYACRAEYSSITFFASDVTKTSSDDSILGGLTLYTTSSQDVESPFYTDPFVQDLQTAIDVLLYAGGGISSTSEPTYARRAAIYGEDAGDVNSFAMYLILTQLGKYLRYYGDGDDDGLKGGGSLSNTCLSDYENVPLAVETAITTAGETGSCVTTNGGHSELADGVAAATRRQRLCQGVVLINNLFELLPFVLADAAGTDLDDISAVTDEIDDAKDALEVLVPGIGSVMTVQSQSNCETDTNISMADIESYFAAIMETSFK